MSEDEFADPNLLAAPVLNVETDNHQDEEKVSELFFGVRRDAESGTGSILISWADSRLAEVSPLLAMASDWRRLLCSAVGEEELRALRRRERTGRPLGDEEFMVRLEQHLGRVLRRQKPGRKSKRAEIQIGK